jgi:transposase-like protein
VIKTFTDALMSMNAEALCNAEYGQVSEEAETVELAIPKLRSGSYFPHWLLVRRRRAEQTLVVRNIPRHIAGVSRQTFITQIDPRSYQECVDGLDGATDAAG